MTKVKTKPKISKTSSRKRQKTTKNRYTIWSKQKISRLSTTFFDHLLLEDAILKFAKHLESNAKTTIRRSLTPLCSQCRQVLEDNFNKNVLSLVPWLKYDRMQRVQVHGLPTTEYCKYAMINTDVYIQDYTANRWSTRIVVYSLKSFNRQRLMLRYEVTREFKLSRNVRKVHHLVAHNRNLYVVNMDACKIFMVDTFTGVARVVAEYNDDTCDLYAFYFSTRCYIDEDFITFKEFPKKGFVAFSLDGAIADIRPRERAVMPEDRTARDVFVFVAMSIAGRIVVKDRAGCVLRCGHPATVTEILTTVPKVDMLRVYGPDLRPTLELDSVNSFNFEQPRMLLDEDWDLLFVFEGSKGESGKNNVRLVAYAI